jgi:hypothetical protein
MYIDSYIVKYSTAGPVTETNWSTAYNCTANGNVVIFNVSLAPGSLQNCTVTNLSENTTYYFAVKSIGGGQLSAISTPSTTNATALQPNLDVGEWWLWIIRSNTSNTSQNNKFTYKNYCYQIDFVDAVNQSIDYNNTAGFPTINTTNTARIEYNMDTNLSNDSLWGRGRSRVIGAPTVGYAGNLMWDTVGWVKSNDPTVWVRMNALPEVIGAGNMIYGTAAGMSPNFGYYNYSDAAIGGTELRATDGYPFNLTDAAWMQNVFGNAWPVVAALSPQNEAYGGFFKVAGYNASYNVSAVTDQEGNASAYNAAMFMNTSPYSTWYLTANRTYASNVNFSAVGGLSQWWYSPQAHNIVRHIDNLSYCGWEDQILLGYEVRDFGKSNLVVTGWGTSSLTVNMTITNNMSDSTQNFSVLCCLLNMSAQTRGHKANVLFKNGECVYPAIHSPTSTTWPEFDAIKFTGDLTPGQSKVMTWTIPYTPATSTWAVWCSGLTNVSTGVTYASITGITP